MPVRSKQGIRVPTQLLLADASGWQPEWFFLLAMSDLGSTGRTRCTTRNARVGDSSATGIIGLVVNTAVILSPARAVSSAPFCLQSLRDTNFRATKPDP